MIPSIPPKEGDNVNISWENLPDTSLDVLPPNCFQTEAVHVAVPNTANFQDSKGKNLGNTPVFNSNIDCKLHKNVGTDGTPPSLPDSDKLRKTLVVPNLTSPPLLTAPSPNIDDNSCEAQVVAPSTVKNSEAQNTALRTVNIHKRRMMR